MDADKRRKWLKALMLAEAELYCRRRAEIEELAKQRLCAG